MAIERAEEYKETRIVVKNSPEKDAIASLSLEEREGKLEGLYKGEIALKTYAETTASEIVVTSAGLFFRVGNQQEEVATDRLLRIGPAYIAKKAPQPQTNDPFQPDIPNITNIQLLQIGQLWLRKGDTDEEQKTLSDSLPEAYINTAEGKWQRITPIKASREQLGLIELANNTELELGVDIERAVTPATLEHWKKVREIVTEKEPSFEFFVDGYAGDDSIENDGRDLYRPFRTIERALLEVSRLSYVPGNKADTTSNDYYANSCVYVGIGDYVVDNRQGCSDVNPIVAHTVNSKGPIQPLEVGTITSYNALERKIVVSGLSAEVREGKQIFFGRNGSEGLGHGVVEAINQSTLTLKMIKGTVYSNAQGNVVDKIYIPQHFQYNNNDGGIIVPRGCSIVGGDLRKTRIRPRYLGDLSLWQQDNVCAAPGRTSIFKLTGGTHITTFTFGDNLEEARSHHICTCVEFCSNAELGLYYQKIVKGIGSTKTPVLIPAEFNIVKQETEIVAPTNNSNNVNTVAGTSPYVFNCSVLSRYGLCGMLVDGNKVTGLKSMVTAQFTNVSLQVDAAAFVTDTSSPGGKAYKPEWRHFAFKAINNGYVQIVSCFVIGSAQHYIVEGGGELSVTNSCSNFGDLGLVAEGHSSEVLGQDKGGVITNVIPPKKIPFKPIDIPILTINSSDSTDTKLYLNADGADGESILERLAPFSFLNGETLYVNQFVSGQTVPVQRTALIVNSGTILASDDKGYFINIQSGSEIINNKAAIDGYPVFIKRIPDSRTVDERIYWFEVTGLSEVGKRRPVENFVLKFGAGTSDNKSLGNKIFIGLVKDTYHDGTPLQAGSYLISLLSSNSLANDLLDNIYPPITKNIIAVTDSIETSPSGISYQATSKVITALLGGDITDYLKATEHSGVNKGKKLLNNKQISTEFLRPSLIRCSGHTFEWVGYMNYSSALPKFQDKVLTFQQSLERMKRETNGGRVYHTAMDQDGNFYIGNRLIDLKTGEERNTISNESNDSKVFKRVTVSERLLMFPNSTLDIRSTKLSMDTQTNFTTPITHLSETYAKETKGGFVQLATLDDTVGYVRKSNEDRNNQPGVNVKALTVKAAGEVLGNIWVDNQSKFKRPEKEGTSYPDMKLELTAGTYAKSDAAGFVQLATNNEAKTYPTNQTLHINSKAITVETLAAVLDSLMPIGTIIESISRSSFKPAWGEWKFCDGSLIPKDIYTKYWEAVGRPNTIGDNEIALPDRRGRVSVGTTGEGLGRSDAQLPDAPFGEGNKHTFTIDGVAFNPPYNLPEGVGDLPTFYKYGGLYKRSMTINEMPVHDHTINPHSHTINPHNHHLNENRLGQYTAGGGSRTLLSNGNQGTRPGDAEERFDTILHTALTTNDTGLTTNNRGESSPMKIMQPYIVCYHWVRVK